MSDPTAAARVKRWRARKRGEAVPHRKPGRPAGARDGFLDLDFIARELQRLQGESAVLHSEFAQIEGHLHKVARRLDENQRRLSEILRLVSANLAQPDDLLSPAAPDIQKELRAVYADITGKRMPEKVSHGSSQDLSWVDPKHLNIKL